MQSNQDSRFIIGSRVQKSAEMTPEQQQSLIEMERLLERTLQQARHNNEKITHLADELNNVTTGLDSLMSSPEVIIQEVDCLTEQIQTATNIFVDSIGTIQEMQAKVNKLRRQQD